MNVLILAAVILAECYLYRLHRARRKALVRLQRRGRR